MPVTASFPVADGAKSIIYESIAIFSLYKRKFLDVNCVFYDAHLLKNMSDGAPLDIAALDQFGRRPVRTSIKSLLPKVIDGATSYRLFYLCVLLCLIIFP